MKSFDTAICPICSCTNQCGVNSGVDGQFNCWCKDKTINSQTWNLPIVISGTYDGMEALMSRFAAAQRVSDPHHLERFKSIQDKDFMNNFLPQLMKYQYVKTPIKMSDEFAQMILDFTGGIIRLILKLWIAAHKYAFRRGDDYLRMEDFIAAEKNDFVFLRDAIKAVKSDDPKLRSKFEDMMSKLSS